jgi:hypothetical protein
MTKTTNILRCTLTPALRSEFTSELADIELYMLCSDKIAAAARKLKVRDFFDSHNNDDRKLDKYLSDYCRLEAKIVKTFKRELECQIDFQVNPDSLPSETRSRLESIRDGFIDDIDNINADFLWICGANGAEPPVSTRDEEPGLI